jgi:hypothetical protein
LAIFLPQLIATSASFTLLASSFVFSFTFSSTFPVRCWFGMSRTEHEREHEPGSENPEA